MTPSNPILARLGLSTNARGVIFHADDIGMCHAGVEAYRELATALPWLSAAVMAPCPWFPYAAATIRELARTHTLDVGVHLTLNSEWDRMRWGPISGDSAGGGLCDREGYFYRDCDPLQLEATQSAVLAELQAQIARVQQAGIDVTHFDSHMGALFHPRFLKLYLELARLAQVPALMLRPSAFAGDLPVIFDEVPNADFTGQLEALEAAGASLLDRVEMMSLEDPHDRLEQAVRVLAGLPPGLSYFIIHPATDTPELRALAPDWACRVADYRLFLDDRWHQAIAAAGVHPVTWRDLRALIRADEAPRSAHGAAL